MRRCSNASPTAPSQRTPPRRRSRGAGGYPFATAPDDLSDPVVWRPELTAVTVILDAAPDGFATAVPVDPRALGALLTDLAGIELGRAASPLPRGWPLTSYRLARLDLILRALDLRHGGATYRQIAAELGREDATKLSASDWKMSASRSFVVRLVRDGIAMMNGDYRKLLRIR